MKSWISIQPGEQRHLGAGVGVGDWTEGMFLALGATVYKQAPPQNPGIILWKVSPLYYRLPPMGECSRNLSVSVYQLALLWEAAFGFSEFFFFEDSFNMFAHFVMGDLGTHLPTLCWVFSSFWPKTAWPPCPTIPIHPVLPWPIFFVSPNGKVLKWECFVDVEKVK